MSHADADESIYINTLNGNNNLDIDMERLEGKTVNEFTIKHLQSETIECVNGVFDNINAEFTRDEQEIATIQNNIVAIENELCDETAEREL
jgi:hypothetical protein